MSKEEKNKAAIRRDVEEVTNKGNLAVVDEITASDYVLHISPEVKGPEGYKQFINIMRAAFPDLHMKIDYMVAEKDMVAVFYTLTGTFKGEMAGIRPTGKNMTTKSAALIRFKSGKQVEAWRYTDMLAFYQQLGIKPPGG
jgi:predicted ester cyclase